MKGIIIIIKYYLYRVAVSESKHCFTWGPIRNSSTQTKGENNMKEPSTYKKQQQQYIPHQEQK